MPPRKLTLNQRRARIRRAAQAVGFAVYGREIDVAGRAMVMRLVLPVNARAKAS